MTYAFIFVVVFISLHILFFERKKDRKDVGHSYLGAFTHTIFVVGDSLIFMGIFTFLKDKENEPLVLIGCGVLIVVLATVMFRLLVSWSGKNEF